MTGALRTELVVVEDLAPADREAFLDELGALVSTIFVNYGRDYLAKDMAAPHLASARVLMMRDGDGQLVGYNQVRRFAYQIDGRTVPARPPALLPRLRRPILRRPLRRLPRLSQRSSQLRAAHPSPR